MSLSGARLICAEEDVEPPQSIANFLLALRDRAIKSRAGNSHTISKTIKMFRLIGPKAAGQI